MATNNIVEAKALQKSYFIDGGTVEALKGVDIALGAGESVAVIGASGAGKSTLLYQLGLLETPTSGEVFLEGRPVSEMTENDRARRRRRKIGFVFQFHHLLREFTAHENVMMPGIIDERDMDQCRERAKYLLEQVGLSERLYHKPGELSGGEQQRVAFARALMNEPTLILADEPTGNLDREASKLLSELLWSVCRERKAALVVATHNDILARGADRVLRMSDGKLIELYDND